MRTRDGLPPTVMIWAPRLVSMIQSEDVVLAGFGCTFAFTPAAGRSGRGRVPPAPSHHRGSGLTPLPRASQKGERYRWSARSAVQVRLPLAPNQETGRSRQTEIDYENRLLRAP